MSESTQERPSTIEGEPAIERVILQEEVKLYRTKSAIAFLDGPVYDFAPATVEFGRSPLPVYSDDMKQLGFAEVKLEKTATGQSLIADMTIDYACEERLVAETQQERRWPRLFGRMSVPAFPVFDFQQRIPVVKLVVDGIVISRDAPGDTRVVPFGVQAL